MRQFILLLFTIISSPVFSQEAAWDQPMKAGASCEAVAMDSKGKLYFSGSVTQYTDSQWYFNTTDLPKGFYAYLAKTDSNHNIEWLKTTETVLSSIRIQTDHSDNVIMIGQFNSRFKLDSLEIDLGDRGGFKRVILVAKFDPSGKLLWHNIIQGQDGFKSSDIEIDDEDNVYVAGTNRGLATFFNGSAVDTVAGINNINEEVIFFAMYDSNGKFRWAKTSPDPHGLSQMSLGGIAVDSERNVYVTGSWYGHITDTFESVKKVSHLSDIFIAKYNKDQKLVWLKQIGTTRNTTSESGNAIALDEKSNSLYVTGGVLGTADFGGGEINTNDRNIFLARYSLQGDLQWVKTAGSWSGAASYIEEGLGLFVDQEGSVYLSGEIGSRGDFDGIQVSANDNPANSNLYFDGFVAKYLPNGQVLWVIHGGGGDDDDYVTAMLKDKNDDLVVVGKAAGRATFGDFQTTLIYGGGFIAKIKEKPEEVFIVPLSEIALEADSNLSRTFELVTNLDWELRSSAEWLSSDSESGKGGGLITLTAQANPTPDPRSAVVEISSSVSGPKKILVTQSGSKNVLSSAEEHAEDGITIYPNPTDGRATIRYSGKIRQISVYDLIGRSLVVKESIRNGQLDISHLEQGIYIIEIETSSSSVIKRLVKR